MNIIETKNLTKSYSDFTAVSGVSLHIPKGTVYGFLGPNGAGKSTTMKMFLGLTRPTGGSFTIDGKKYPEDRVEILMQANWSLMAMLNVLLVVAGACLLYHIEYADNGMQKMESLPVREGYLFFGKNILMALMVLAVLVIEAASLWFCAWHWFGTGAGVQMEFRGQMVLGELGKSMGYSFLLTLPCVAVSLLLSRLCRNMWVSLGIGVICVFTATMLPTDRFLPSLFPYAMPFQVLPGTEPGQAARYLWAAAVEAALAGAAAFIMIRARRWFG